MTDHVRTSYRNHRRTTWGLAIALVLAVAAVAIPIASGAPDKTYTLVFPVTGPQAPPVTPVLGTTGNTALQQNLCTDTTYTSVKLTISNTAPNAQLGSANITFPSIVSLTGASYSGSSPSGATIARTGNVVRLRELSLPKRTGAVTFSVSLTTGSTTAGLTNITAMMKQSNDFSDSGQNPDANAFDNPTFPRIALQTCTATITGRVYHDRDQSGAFAINAASPTSDLVKSNWTVTLQRQTGATFTPIDTDASDANGLYEVEGPAGSNYRLCVTAPAPDNASAWAVRQVTGVTLVTGCSAISPPSPPSKGLSVAPLSAAGATGQDFAVVPVTVFDFDGGDTAGSGNYIVTAGGDTTKLPQHYVQETWTDANGLPYFVFAPINACTGCGEIYLLEFLKGSVEQADLGPAKQVVLLYDDTEPFQTFTAMPYCLQDPRGDTPTDLLTADVLPAGATSCIVEAHQEVRGNGDPDDAFVDAEFFVYSSYDGGRGMG